MSQRLNAVPSCIQPLCFSNYRLYFFFAPVLMPKGRYSGQKLIKLVRINTADKTNNTIATVPEITFAKYNPITTRATRILITLSIVPMFFFIFFSFIKIYLSIRSLAVAWCVHLIVCILSCRF
jgi:hypothetical protein